jgi:hypothetical protein
VQLRRGEDLRLRAGWAWDNALHFAGAAAGQPLLGCPDRDPTC